MATCDDNRQPRIIRLRPPLNVDELKERIVFHVEFEIERYLRAENQIVNRSEVRRWAKKTLLSILNDYTIS